MLKGADKPWALRPGAPPAATRRAVYIQFSESNGSAMTHRLKALRIEHRDDVPDYLQVKQRLGSAVSAGFWNPSETLPAADIIATYCGVDAAAAARALSLLEAERQLRSVPGGGYAITPRIDQALSKLNSLSVSLNRRGYDAASRWISRGLFTPDDDELVYLGIGQFAQVARLERLRLAGGHVLGLERSSLPSRVVPDPEQVEGSLYSYLAAQGHAAATATEYISATVASEPFAQTTGMAPGTPLLHLMRISHNLQGQPIELTHSWFSSEFYRCVVELKN